VIHQRFCNNSQTITQFGQEGSEVGLDRETGEDISGVEEKIHYHKINYSLICDI